MTTAGRLKTVLSTSRLLYRTCRDTEKTNRHARFISRQMSRRFHIRLTGTTYITKVSSRNTMQLSTKAPKPMKVSSTSATVYGILPFAAGLAMKKLKMMG